MLPMPSAPLLAGLLSRYVLENPWPLTGLLVLLGAGLGWRALREGQRALLYGAIALLTAAAAVLSLGLAVTTSGERARDVVAQLVSRAEAGDTAGMLHLMTPGCLLHYGRPQNPGVRRPDWERTIGLLQGRYRIEENTVTRLDADSSDAKTATVELACLTTVSIAPYPTPSAWWLRVAEQPDGEWKIDRIAFLRVAKQEPTPGSF
jgi:hypothetical protein